MSQTQQNSALKLFMLAVLLTAGVALGQGDVTLDVELRASRPVLFVHEPFELDIVVRSSGVRLGQGFQLQGLPPEDALRRGEFGELPAQDELRGNTLQSVRKFRCEALAMKPGEMRIEPTLELSILTRQMGFFGPSWVEQRKQVAARPLALTVRALPEAGLPPGFSGAVGRFTLGVSVSPPELAVGDLVKISSVVRGQGYLDGISPPTLSSPMPGFKVYAATERASTVPTERLFDQTLIPEGTNACVIPALAFTFFDPVQVNYQTLRQGPFKLSFRARADATFVPYRPTAQAGAPKAAPDVQQSVVKHPEPTRDARQIVLVTLYWVGAGVVALLVFHRGRKLRFLALLVPAIALAGFHPVLRAASRGRAGAEARFIRAESVRFAPSPQSPVQWQATSGTVARVTESWGRWRQVEVGQDAGWAQEDALQP